MICCLWWGQSSLNGSWCWTDADCYVGQRGGQGAHTGLRCEGGSPRAWWLPCMFPWGWGWLGWSLLLSCVLEHLLFLSCSYSNLSFHSSRFSLPPSLSLSRCLVSEFLLHWHTNISGWVKQRWAYAWHVNLKGNILRISVWGNTRRKKNHTFIVINHIFRSWSESRVSHTHSIPKTFRQFHPAGQAVAPQSYLHLFFSLWHLSTCCVNSTLSFDWNFHYKTDLRFTGCVLTPGTITGNCVLTAGSLKCY